MSGRGKARQGETSQDTAARFLALRRHRAHRKGVRGMLICCPRYAWGDGTHDLDCRLYRAESAQ